MGGSGLFATAKCDAEGQGLRSAGGNHGGPSLKRFDETLRIEEVEGRDSLGVRSPAVPDPFNYNNLPPTTGCRPHSAEGQWEALKAQGRLQTAREDSEHQKDSVPLEPRVKLGGDSERRSGPGLHRRLMRLRPRAELHLMSEESKLPPPDLDREQLTTLLKMAKEKDCYLE